MWRSGVAVVVILGLGCACDGGSASSSSTTPGDTEPYVPPDDPASLPAEALFVEVTLAPFWEQRVIDVPADGGGYSLYGDTSEELSGVTVCVEQVRSRGESWEDFEDWEARYPDREQPCHVTRAAEGRATTGPVVLSGVPALSEVLVVAQKDGYRPTLIPAATPGHDLDARNFGIACRLVRLDSSWPEIGGVEVDPTLGIVGLDVRACVGAVWGEACHDLRGARLRIEPPAGDGPFYGRGGRYDPAADRTTADVPAELVDATYRPRNVVVNVPPGEYRFIVEHEAARCRVNGRVGSNPIFGFPTTEPNTVLFPVLPGHVTPFVGQQCDCLVDPSLGLPSNETCLLPDGGAASR